MPSVNSLFLQYFYLQLLDLMTTLAFLLNGIREGNPVVRFFVLHAPNPITGLVLVKIGALALGIYCWRGGRHKLLNRINILFAGVVAWNLAALIASTLHSA